MKVLKATEAQYNDLNGYANGNSKLEFVKDAYGNWIVGKLVLSDIAFLPIRPQLEELEEIEFNPIILEE